MAERLMAEGATSPDINTTAQAAAEQTSNAQQTGRPSGRLGSYSPEFDPNRKDYQTKEEESYYVYIDPDTGKEVARIPKILGASLDVPTFLANAKSTLIRSEQLRQWLETYDEKKINLAALSPAESDNYKQSRAENLQEMGDLINAARARGVLSYLIEDIQRIYTAAVPPKADARPPIRRRRRLMYGEQHPEPTAALKSIDERVGEVHKALDNYKEAFWDYGDATLRTKFGISNIVAMKETFKGVPSYLAARVAIAIEKELKGQPLDPTNELGDYFLAEIKRQLEYERRRVAAEEERQKQRQRRNATPDQMLEYNDWRRSFEFGWAETREELRASVFGWLEKFEKHLPNEIADTVHQEGGKWKANAIEALEAAAHELNISEKEPFFEELRNIIEAHTDVLVGVKLVESDGGFEPFTGYLEAFAHNFNAHHDAIYLGNVKSAIIQHFLRRRHRGAISMGAPGTLEKPQAGDIEDFRGNMEEEAKLYAATHELYIREVDFERAVAATVADVARIEGEVALLNLPPEKAMAEIQKRIDETNRRYGWDDEIERLLLTGGDRQKAMDAHDIQALMRMDIRSGVFQRIKKRLDKEDEARDGRSFDQLSEDERRGEIRFRIRAKMVLAGYKALAEDIDATTDIAEKDRKLWNWLKEYNQTRERQGHDLYFPSKWDTVRLSINRPTKLVDRALSEEELDAMIEEVGVFRTTIGVTGQEVALSIDDLTDEEIKTAIENLNWTGSAQPNLVGGGLNAEQIEKAKTEILEDALFDKLQRQTEAERAFNINRTYQKFLGVDARWGGMAVRVVNDEGEVVLRNVWDIAEEILKAKIDKEEADIEAQVTAHEVALRARGGLTAAQIEEAKVNRRRLLRRDSTFGATLALREIGIANDLPIWNYYYYNDPQRIQTFAPLVGYTHNDKVELVDLLDRGRREMRAVWDYLADTYMDGRVLIVRDEANAGVDENGQTKDFHQERWDRARVINEAGVTALREVFESRFMLSTSGGIEMVDLISKIGDLGIYDLLWEMGCKDFREFQGFVKRRDEVELKKQSFWNIRNWRDPITYAKRLRGAGAAVTYLRGGEVKGGQREPGVLQEPLMGAYKYRDEYVKPEIWIDSNIRNSLEQKRSDFKEILQKILENEGNLKQLTAQEQDRLVEVGAGVLVDLIKFMDALRYKMNRAGLAPKNWKLDNEHIFRHYAVELLKRVQLSDKATILGGGEKLGDQDLGYAVQGRSRLTVKVFENILRTSSYHILVEKDRKAFDDKGVDVKNRMDTRRGQLLKQPLLPEEQRRINNRRDKLRAQGMGARIASLTARNVLSQDEVNATEITDKRKEELRSRGATDEEINSLLNLNKELQRLRNYYIDERLHKEFYGEWPAKLAEVAKQLEPFKLGT